MTVPVALEQLIGVERLALLRQAVLVPRDLARVVPAARPGDDVVVLVHGFLASAGVFRPLRARLEQEAQARVATFTHVPGRGVESIARSLAELVDRIPRGTRITVVGHSLGGVVARWYVQEMAGHERVTQTISLAAPFGGVDVPPYLVGADLHGQSALLRKVRDGARACCVPHTSIVGAEDDVVVGVETASLGIGEVIVLPRGHNGLLFCERAGAIVVDRIRQAARAA